MMTEEMTEEDSNYSIEWFHTSKNMEKRGIYDRVSRFVNIGSFESALELGCGNCKNLVRICEVTNPRNSLIVGIDQNYYLLDMGRSNLEEFGNRAIIYRPMDEAELKPGNVSLVLDDYNESKFPYLREDIFDKTLLTFFGTPFIKTRKISARISTAMNKIQNFLKKNGEFIYVDRIPNEKIAKVISDRIEKNSKNFVLKDFEFQESFEDYISTYLPRSASHISRGLNLEPTLSDRERFEIFFKSQRIQPQFGIVYMKFRKL